MSFFAKLTDRRNKPKAASTCVEIAAVCRKVATFLQNRLKKSHEALFDTGLVRGDDGIRFENAVATMLLKHVHFLQDVQGQEVGLHAIRTKDGAEVDFVLSRDKYLTHLVECKLAETTRSRSLVSFSQKFPRAEAIQLVRNLRQEEFRDPIRILDAANWLNGLAA